MSVPRPSGGMMDAGWWLMLPALGGLTPSQVGRQQESLALGALALTDPPPIVLRSKQEMTLPCRRYRLRWRLFSAWSIRH